jgi:hypothetical protein
VTSCHPPDMMGTEGVPFGMHPECPWLKPPMLVLARLFALTTQGCKRQRSHRLR